MKQPESIYVSRQEVLNNLQLTKMSNHHNHHHQQNKKISASQTPKIHDSWSSRASSILAKGLSEPKYMSRTEMLEKLAQLSHVQDVAHLEAMTAMIHGNDDEEEEENDVDKRFHEISPPPP